MNDERLWTAGSRRLAVLLLAVALPPSATLVWLGWQLLDQDRALLAQRETEQRQAAADAVVHSLQLSIADVERQAIDHLPPAGTVRLTVTPDGIRAEPRDRIAWLPAAASPIVDDDTPFADAERLEYQGDVERASAAYEAAERSRTAAVRVGALLRLARVRRRQRRWDDALGAYRAIEQGAAEVAIAGTPADLLAKRAVCGVLVDAGRIAESQAAAAALESDLLAGRWTVDRVAWELAAADVARWRGRPIDISPERQAFSEAAALVWAARGEAARPSMAAGVRPITILWGRDAGGRLVALAVSSEVVRGWTSRAAAAPAARGARVNLLGPSGERLPGAPLDRAAPIVDASSSQTGLPWTVAVQSVGSASTLAALSARRRLLSTGLAAILLLIGGGSFFLWRLVQRELALARLQTDFVSAVSHEFRTPLTSLRHAAQLLEEDDAMPPDRRAAFYQMLGRNTDRLHRLVESLLDFGRMEGGRKPYDMRPVEIEAAVSDVVAEFQKAAPEHVQVHVDAQVPHGLRVRADPAALSNALWNLLDNAVKYSPAQPIVHVSVRPHPIGVGISVRDQGIGIPAREQKRVFSRFVRGEAATRFGINGTGLGLAMVSHIVRAHRGAVEVASRENAGSTFTILLPADL